VIQPIVVRPVSSGRYEVVAGHRRWLASIELGFKEIPVVVKELDDKAAFEVALVENIHRQTMDPREEGEAFKEYTETEGWGSQTQLAEMIGKTRQYVSDRIGFVALPEEIVNAVDNKRLTVSHAEGMIGLDNEQAMLLSEKVQDVGLDSKQTDKAASYVKRGLTVDQAVQTVLSFPDWAVPDEHSKFDPIAVARDQIVMTLRQTLSTLDTNILAIPEGAERVRWTREVRYEVHRLIDVAQDIKKSHG
jgi:ParB/RepB/Spo0J family partition protein